jgi:hypothetical protein
VIAGQARPERRAPGENSGPPRLSIVVLPRTNMGGGEEHDYFVDGTTESLTTDLSRIFGRVHHWPKHRFHDSVSRHDTPLLRLTRPDQIVNDHSTQRQQ